MAPPSPRGLYHLTLVGELHGQQTQNGFWFADHPTSPADSHQEALIHLINDFQTWVYEKITLFANQEWHTIGLIGTTQVPHNGPLVELGPLSGGGAQVDDSLPSHSAGVLAIRTGSGGRRYHGRVYFAGVSKNLCAGSRLISGSLTQLQDIGDALLGRFGAGGSSTWHQYGVYSHVEGDTRHVGPPPFIEHSLAGFRVATQTIARPVVYTMRKRLIGHGS